MLYSIAAQATFIVEDFPDAHHEGLSIFISGTFEGWSGGQDSYILSNSDGNFSITLPREKDSIAYKFTRGSWESVETDSIGNSIPNRTYAFKNEKDTIKINILGWADSSLKMSTAQKNVSLLSGNFEIPQLNRERPIWVYLPPNYESSKKSFPVLYMHDGQNLFDNLTSFSGEWEVDETLNQLFQEQNLQLIVIGIANGGLKRIDEYSPWMNPEYGGGEGDAYIDFIVNTLKPYVDHHYRTLGDQQNTGLMGSSLAGLISHHGAIKNSNIFGKIGVFSPSFWFSEECFKYVPEFSNDNQQKMYLLMGSKEGEKPIEDFHKMYNLMLARGFKKNHLKEIIVEGGEHNEVLWKNEFKDAILWLYGSL